MLGFDQFLFFSLFLYSGIKIVSISFFSDSSSKKKNKNISDKWKNLFEAYVGVSYLIGRRYNIQKREKNEYQISMDWNGDRQKFRNFFSRFFFSTLLSFSLMLLKAVEMRCCEFSLDNTNVIFVCCFTYWTTSMQQEITHTLRHMFLQTRNENKKKYMMEPSWWYILLKRVAQKKRRKYCQAKITLTKIMFACVGINNEKKKFCKHTKSSTQIFIYPINEHLVYSFVSVCMYKTWISILLKNHGFELDLKKRATVLCSYI